MLCEGYARSLIFINSGQGHARIKKGRFAPHQYSPAPVLDAQKQTRNPGQPPRSRPASPLLEHRLESSAWECKYFEVYWTSMLPYGQAVSPRAAQYSTVGWYGVVQDLCHQDNLVRQALLANAFGLLGHHTGLHSIVMEGWRAYGRSLQMLSRSLSSKGPDSHDRILVTSMLLKQFQLLESTETPTESSPAAIWLKHAPGERAIIAARCPSHYAQGHAHRLFVDTRLNLLYLDIQNRKRSIFSTAIWKSAPWATCTKDPKDELVDVLVGIPGLLEEFDSLLACPPKPESKHRCLRHQLQAKCWLYDDELERWAKTSGAPTLALVEAVIATNMGQKRTPSLVDLAMAHLGMVYWSTCILLYYPLCILAGTTQENLPERVRPRRYCRKIALLMPYLFAPGVGSFSINMAAFPAAVALRFLARSDPAQQPSEEKTMLLRALSGEDGRQLRNLLKAWPGRRDGISHQGAE